MVVSEGGIEMESLASTDALDWPESLLADEISSFGKHGCAG